VPLYELRIYRLIEPDKYRLTLKTSFESANDEEAAKRALLTPMPPDIKITDQIMLFGESVLWKLGI
jgi:hypothetical protein